MRAGSAGDHTDCKLEEWDIPRAKQICPNVIGATVWSLTGGFAYGSRLAAELEDPELNRRLDLEYDVHPLDGFQ